MHKVADIRNSLMEIVQEELSGDISCVDTCELGETIDMIKDLFEAEKCYYEAWHYKQTVEAKTTK
jgi:hypothetical protein